MRVVTLLLASSGIRLGAIPTIKLRDLEDNKLTIYEHTREEYITFITPECKKAVDFYLDMRSRYGEKLTDNSHLIREQFDLRDQFATRNPKRVTHKFVQWKLMTLAEKCGIRKRGDSKKTRQGIMIAHARCNRHRLFAGRLDIEGRPSLALRAMHVPPAGIQLRDAEHSARRSGLSFAR